MGKKKESLLSKEGTDRNCATFNREGYGLHTPGKRQEFFHYCLQALSSTFLPQHKYVHGKQNKRNSTYLELPWDSSFQCCAPPTLRGDCWTMGVCGGDNFNPALRR